MTPKFERCWPLVLAQEGYGCWQGEGEAFQTCWGITEKYNPDLRFPLTKEQAAQVAYERYWRRCGAEELPLPLALVHFDHSFNRGADAGEALLGETRDYVLYSALRLIRHYTNRREISKALWDINGAGWAKRVAMILESARRFAFEEPRAIDVVVIDGAGIRQRIDGTLKYREMPLAQGKGTKLQISTDSSPKEGS